MPKSYWITDTEGVYALVESAEARDEWTKVHGWSWAAGRGPGLTDQVHVVNENPEIGPGRLPYGAVEGWGGLGWKPGPPVEPVDTTKDPVLVDQAVVPVVEPVKPKTQAAAGATDKKE